MVTGMKNANDKERSRIMIAGTARRGPATNRFPSSPIRRFILALLRIIRGIKRGDPGEKCPARGRNGAERFFGESVHRREERPCPVGDFDAGYTASNACMMHAIRLSPFARLKPRFEGRLTTACNEDRNENRGPRARRANSDVPSRAEPSRAEETSASIKHHTRGIGIVESARSAAAYNYHAVRGVNWRIPLPAGCRQKELYKVFRLSGKPAEQGM